MIAKLLTAFRSLGGISFVSGVIILASLQVLPSLPSLRGPYTTTFLAYFLVAGIVYAIAVHRLRRDQLPLKLIWVFAILFRLVMLLTFPTLSDDVYRYAWDGHLLNQGLNPYAQPVSDPSLDAYNIHLRALVNHDWMASPYLPVAQLVFAFAMWIAPQSILAFQVTATVFDLLSGWLVMNLLKTFQLPHRNLLLYLWNPLVIVEFSHGAHVDSLMIFLMLAAFWFLARWGGNAFHRRAVERVKENLQHCSAVLHRLRRSASTKRIGLYASASILAAATLTKPIPLLLAPVFLRRWRWKGILAYIGLILLLLTIFAVGGGWGLFGELDGTGIFGATRIYLQWWNYNGSIYHWLEVLLSGYQTPGAVPVEIVGDTPILVAKAITTGMLGVAILLSGWLAWRNDDDLLGLLRLAVIPLGAYLLLTPTLHPWYLTLIIPFLPFLQTQKTTHAFIWPWVYLSIAVTFSYLTYYDPENLREYTQVRLLEYIPTYLILVLALLRSFGLRKKSSTTVV